MDFGPTTRIIHAGSLAGQPTPLASESSASPARTRTRQGVLASATEFNSPGTPYGLASEPAHAAVLPASTVPCHGMCSSWHHLCRRPFSLPAAAAAALSCCATWGPSPVGSAHLRFSSVLWGPRGRECWAPPIYEAAAGSLMRALTLIGAAGTETSAERHEARRSTSPLPSRTGWWSDAGRACGQGARPA